MQHRIIKEKPIFEHGFIKLVQSEIEIDTFRGDKEVISRYGLIRPKVVAAVLYRKDIDRLILIKQFRYSALKSGNGWIKEIIAGVVEEGENIIDSAKRECLEESGYRIQDNFREVLAFYPSVGLSDQIIHLFYGEVTASDKVDSGGGLIEEKEDIQIHELDPTEVYQDLIAGKYTDAKALIGLMWFFHNIKKPL